MLADDPPFSADAVHISSVAYAVSLFASFATATVISISVRCPMPRVIRFEPSHQWILWQRPSTPRVGPRS